MKNKIKILILAILIVITVIYGIPNAKNALNSYSKYSALNNELSHIKAEKTKTHNDINKIANELREMNPEFDITDKVAITNKIVNTSKAKLVSIKAYKTNAVGESVLVAKLTSETDVANISTDVDLLEFELSAENIKTSLKSLEKLQLDFKSVSAVALDNTIILKVLTIQ